MGIIEWTILSVLTIGVVFGVLSFKRLPLDMRYLTFFFITTLTLELASDYVMTLRQRNLYLYHIFIPIQYLYLAIFYKENIDSKFVKIGILASIFFIFITETVFILTIQTLNDSPSLISFITRIILLFWVLIYLLSLLKKEIPVLLVSLPAFWVSIGFLFYFTSIFPTGLMDYLISINRKAAHRWYNLGLWFDVLFYIICIIPLYQFFSKITK